MRSAVDSARSAVNLKAVNEDKVGALFLYAAVKSSVCYHMLDLKTMAVRHCVYIKSPY